MGKEPSLLDQFRSTKTKETRCVVCFKVAPEVREVVEDGIRRGHGSVFISKWLRERGVSLVNEWCPKDESYRSRMFIPRGMIREEVALSVTSPRPRKVALT